MIRRQMTRSLLAQGQPVGGGMGSIDRGESPLKAASIGTAHSDLIQPCDQLLRATDPPEVNAGIPLALTFSGGGFRATLAALGVLRFVADAGRLERVRYVSSVSGGSLANGLFAHYYEDLERAGFTPEALDEYVINPFLRRVCRKSLSRTLLLNIWRTIGPKTRTELLADTFDKWFFEGRKLEDLSTGCRFIFNAANVTTGVRFAFEREIVGDWVMGRAHTRGTSLRLATGAAASAAVPGAFAPLKIKDVKFPCAAGREALLLDGGAYDNSGIEAIDNLSGVLLVALNAGGLFRTGKYGGVPIVRDLQRANSLLYRQSTGLRFRDMVARFRAYELARTEDRPPPPESTQGVLFGLASTIASAPDEWTRDRDEDFESVPSLAGYKTSFAKFPKEIAHKLIYRGWWLAGATLSTYHREELPETLPIWRSLP
jgi:NTE family protein